MLNRIKEHIIKTGITESIILLLLLILPFLPKVIPPVIIAIFLCAFYEKKISATGIRQLRNLPTMLLCAFFALYLVGMSWTNDFQEGISTLERLLLLLLFPLFFSGFNPINKKELILKSIKVFIFSITVSALICVVIANIYFWYEIYAREYRVILEDYPYTNYFFYSYLSRFMHYGYYSLFVNMALGFQLWLLINNHSTNSGKKKIKQWINVTFLSVFVLMLYAKAGLLTLFIIYLITIVYILIRLKNRLITLTLAGVFIFTIFFAIRYIPNTIDRIMEVKNNVTKENLDKTSAESTQIRLMVWDASYELIQSSPYVGHGTGDAQNALNKIYKRDGIVAAYEKNLNSHNQFLQSWIETGIAGFIILILYFGYYFIFAWRKGNRYLAIIYLLIIAINFLTESTLRTQNGVLFTSLFGCFILFMGKWDEKSV